MRENLLTAVVNDEIWTLVRPEWFGGAGVGSEGERREVACRHA